MSRSAHVVPNFLPLLALAFISLFLAPQLSTAQPEELKDIVHPLADVFVHLAYPTPEGLMEQNGRGFVIRVPGGYGVVTAYHVAEGVSGGMVQFFHGPQIDVDTILAYDPYWDIAILRLDSLPEPVQPLTLQDIGEDTVNQRIALMGPNSRTLLPPQFGNIKHIYRISPSRWAYSTSVPSSPGLSGSPGRLVTQGSDPARPIVSDRVMGLNTTEMGFGDWRSGEKKQSQALFVPARLVLSLIEKAGKGESLSAYSSRFMKSPRAVEWPIEKLIRAQNYSKANQLYRELPPGPRSRNFYYDMGSMMMEMKDYPAAINFFSLASTTPPKTFGESVQEQTIYYSAGLSEARLGHLESAIKHTDQALRLPLDPDTRARTELTRVVYMLATGNVEPAKKAVSEYERSYPKNLEESYQLKGHLMDLEAAAREDRSAAWIQNFRKTYLTAK